MVIADTIMAGKDGLETVREILAIYPGALIFTMSGVFLASAPCNTSR